LGKTPVSLIYENKFSLPPEESLHSIQIAGLDLYEISSGKRKGERRISKRRRSLLRDHIRGCEG
jgi:hypothetical protein